MTPRLPFASMRAGLIPMGLALIGWAAVTVAAQDQPPESEVTPAIEANIEATQQLRSTLLRLIESLESDIGEIEAMKNPSVNMVDVLMQLEERRDVALKNLEVTDRYLDALTATVHDGAIDAE